MKKFFIDPQFSDVLVFSNKADLSQNPLIGLGHIFIQDKVNTLVFHRICFCWFTMFFHEWISPRLIIWAYIFNNMQSLCVAARVLSPPVGSDVIDACAAQGEQTVNLSSIIKNKG